MAHLFHPVEILRGISSYQNTVRYVQFFDLPQSMYLQSYQIVYPLRLSVIPIRHLEYIMVDITINIINSIDFSQQILLYYQIIFFFKRFNGIKKMSVFNGVNT